MLNFGPHPLINRPQESTLQAANVCKDPTDKISSERTSMNITISRSISAAFGLLTCAAALTAMTITQNAHANDLLVYFGTYTNQGSTSKGIYFSHLDTKTGKLSAPELAAETVNPSFLVLHPNRKYLYAVNEVGQYKGKASGYVTAYAIDAKSGKLKELNQQPTDGTDPCHIEVDNKGKHVLIANYSSGSAIVLPIQADGSLGPRTSFVQHTGTSVNKARQEGPHAHSANLDSSNKHAIIDDLGIDKVMVYKYDGAKGTLTPNDPPSAQIDAGSGPRHFAFHPSEKFAYVINELSSTVVVMTYDAVKGALIPFQTLSTLPTDFAGESFCAELKMHPNGKFLYGSNRGHDSLAIFSVDQETGRLTAVGYQSTMGKIPRNFDIEPSGKLLLAANQESNSVHTFRIDTETGKLTPTGEYIEIGKPVCVVFMPAK